MKNMAPRTNALQLFDMSAGTLYEKILVLKK